MDSCIRLRLFDSLMDSPVSTADFKWNELDAVITPFGKGENSVDSGFGSARDKTIDLPKPRPGSDVRKGLFSGKRLSETLSKEIPTKRQRTGLFQHSPNTKPGNVIQAVDKLTSQQQLVADGSRDYTLPSVPGKHSDLRSISADTMADVLSGIYNDNFGEVTIVDCRYPYEFEGGHIRGAVNMYTKDDVLSLLQKHVTSDKPHVLIFHCEFSSERGPKMYRFLRSKDRELNKDCYPKLNFPEVYLLDGGYKPFFATQRAHCQPRSYTPMLHEDHAADLRHFRVKSKSWTAGETQQISRRAKSRRLRTSLEF